MRTRAVLLTKPPSVGGTTVDGLTDAVTSPVRPDRRQSDVALEPLRIDDIDRNLDRRAGRHADASVLSLDVKIGLDGNANGRRAVCAPRAQSRRAAGDRHVLGISLRRGGICCRLKRHGRCGLGGVWIERSRDAIGKVGGDQRHAAGRRVDAVDGDRIGHGRALPDVDERVSGRQAEVGGRTGIGLKGKVVDSQLFVVVALSGRDLERHDVVGAGGDGDLRAKALPLGHGGRPGRADRVSVRVKALNGHCCRIAWGGGVGVVADVDLDTAGGGRQCSDGAGSEELAARTLIDAGNLIARRRQRRGDLGDQGVKPAAEVNSLRIVLVGHAGAGGQVVEVYGCRGRVGARDWRSVSES